MSGAEETILRDIQDKVTRNSVMIENITDTLNDRRGRIAALEADMHKQRGLMRAITWGVGVLGGVISITVATVVAMWGG